MGCFTSRPADASKTAPVAAAPATTPVTAAPAAVPVEVAAAPVRRTAPVSDVDRATLALKSNRDRVQQALEAAERQCDADMSTAIALKSAGKTDRAVLVMKRRRLVRMRVDDAYTRLGNLEAMLTTLETQESTGQMLQAMKESNAALTEFNKVCNAETIQRAKDDWTEQAEETKRVREVLNRAAEDGVDLPSDAELQAMIDEFSAGEEAAGKTVAKAVGETGEEAAKEVPPAGQAAAPPAALSPEEAKEKLDAAEETPDIMPAMPVADEGKVPAPVAATPQERRQPTLA